MRRADLPETQRDDATVHTGKILPCTQFPSGAAGLREGQVVGEDRLRCDSAEQEWQRGELAK